MRQFAKINVTDRKLALVQDALANALNPILKTQLLDGNLLQSVDLVTGNNYVPHLLGRNLTGWFITRINAAVSVYDQQDYNANKAATVLLVASAPATVDLWVF